MNSQFHRHGYSEIQLDGNIIYITAFGPWNDEYFDDLHVKLTAVVQTVDISNYGVYLQPTGEAIAPQSAIESHLNFISRSQVKAVALNLQDCTTNRLTRSLCTNLYNKANINHKYFDNKETAIAWIRSYLD